MFLRKDDSNEINVSIVGGSYIGKTTLFNKIFNMSLTENKAAYYNFCKKKEIDIEGKKYILNIYDTPGYDSEILTKEIAMKYSDIIIFIYKTNQLNTFDYIKLLYETLNHPKYNKILQYYNSSLGKGEDIYKSFAIIGNIYNDYNSYDYYNYEDDEQIKAFANSINAKYIDISFENASYFEIEEILIQLVKEHLNCLKIKNYDKFNELIKLNKYCNY